MADLDPALVEAQNWLDDHGLQATPLAYNSQIKWYTPAHLKSLRKPQLPRAPSFWEFLQHQGWQVTLQSCNSIATAL